MQESQTIRKDPYPSASLFLYILWQFTTVATYVMFLSLWSQPCFTLFTHAIPKPVSQAMLLPCYMYPVMMPCSLFSYPLSEDLYFLLSWPLPFVPHQSFHYYSLVIYLAILPWNIFSITDLRHFTQTYYLHTLPLTYLTSSFSHTFL
jgi:hypothetical protein